MIAERRHARRWLSDRDARSLTFLDLDTRHLTDVRFDGQVAHYYVSDRPRWEYELHVVRYKLTFRRRFRTWTTDVWMVDHGANIWRTKTEDTPIVLFNTEEVFDSEAAAWDRYYDRIGVMRSTFKKGMTYYIYKEKQHEDPAP